MSQAQRYEGGMAGRQQSAYSKGGYRGGSRGRGRSDGGHGRGGRNFGDMKVENPVTNAGQSPEVQTYADKAKGAQNSSSTAETKANHSPDDAPSLIFGSWSGDLNQMGEGSPGQVPHGSSNAPQPSSSGAPPGNSGSQGSPSPTPQATAPFNRTGAEAPVQEGRRHQSRHHNAHWHEGRQNERYAAGAQDNRGFYAPQGNNRNNYNQNRQRQPQQQHNAYPTSASPVTPPGQYMQQFAPYPVYPGGQYPGMQVLMPYTQFQGGLYTPGGHPFQQAATMSVPMDVHPSPQFGTWNPPVVGSPQHQRMPRPAGAPAIQGAAHHPHPQPLPYGPHPPAAQQPKSSKLPIINPNTKAEVKLDMLDASKRSPAPAVGSHPVRPQPPPHVQPPPPPRGPPPASLRPHHPPVDHSHNVPKQEVAAAVNAALRPAAPSQAAAVHTAVAPAPAALEAQKGSVEPKAAAPTVPSEPETAVPAGKAVEVEGVSPSTPEGPQVEEEPEASASGVLDGMKTPEPSSGGETWGTPSTAAKEDLGDSGEVGAAEVPGEDLSMLEGHGKLVGGTAVGQQDEATGQEKEASSTSTHVAPSTDPQQDSESAVGSPSKQEGVSASTPEQQHQVAQEEVSAGSVVASADKAAPETVPAEEAVEPPEDKVEEASKANGSVAVEDAGGDAEGRGGAEAEPSSVVAEAVKAAQGSGGSKETLKESNLEHRVDAVAVDAVAGNGNLPGAVDDNEVAASSGATRVKSIAAEMENSAPETPSEGAGAEASSKEGGEALVKARPVGGPATVVAPPAVPLPAAPPVEQKKKKKNAIKAACSKADAEGQGDMLEIFREPKPVPDARGADALASEPAPGSAPAPSTVPEASNGSAAPVEEEEPDNWEEQAEVAEETADKGQPSSSTEVVEKGPIRYTRDFIKSLSKANTQRPDGLIPGDYLKDGSPGFDYGLPRRGSGRALDGDGGKWGRGPAVGPPGGDFGRMGGPMRGQPGPPPPGRRDGRGPPMGGMDNDRWQRGGPFPGPPGPGMRPQPPAKHLPALHKTSSRWTVGLSSTDDPEEEKKQKTIKGLMNKLTPDNFEKIFNQILEVGIETAGTLEGLINQVFDKALTEPHFCDLYSQLCKQLSEKLPEFDADEGEGKKKITFRRLLLNKCQEEFEKGDAAMTAVEKREQEEGKEVEDKVEQGKGKEDLEEGEVADEVKAAKVADRLKAEEELKARRRMLGNIQFIGFLYQYRMLTEKIIHTCIVRLLYNEHNPKLEDLECLCKLLTTVGRLLEGQQERKKADPDRKNTMSAYMTRIERLINNKSLESRIRFMLQDIIDMRNNNWEERRKAEGPKKIEDVHKEARLDATLGRDRDSGRGGSRRGLLPPDPLPPPQQRLPSFTRREDLAGPIRALEKPSRQSSGEISLRPQGFGIKTASPMRGAGAILSAPEPSSSRPLREPDTAPSTSSTIREEPPPPSLSPEQIRGKAKGFVEEYHQNKNEKDSLESLAELRAGGADMPSVLCMCLKEALEYRKADVKVRLAPFKDFFLGVLTMPNTPLPPAEFCQGLLQFTNQLPDLLEENINAKYAVSSFSAAFVAEGHVSLGAFGQALLEAGEKFDEEEDMPLVGSGDGWDILTSLLKEVKGTAGEAKAKSLWQSSGLSLASFFGSSHPASETEAALKQEVERAELGFDLA